MHPFVAHKWACLALLWGFSTTLALPFEDDSLFALASAPTDSAFTSEPLPIDGGSEPLFFDDYSPGSTDFLNLGGDSLLGYDTSLGSGTEVAYATGDCKLGEVVQDVGAVAFAGACPAEFSSQGCGRTMGYVIEFDSRLPYLCATKNQYCCGGASSAGLVNCHNIPQPSAVENILNYDVGKAFQNGWAGLVNGNPGGSLGSGGNFNPLKALGDFVGVGNSQKKRSNDFCAAAPYS